MQARAGDKLTIGGPRGSLVVPEDYAWQLYVCDESGMPALRRRLEGLNRLTVRPEVKAVVTVGDASYKDYFAHLSDYNIDWVVGHDGQTVVEKLTPVAVPSEDYFIWLTGEGAVVKALLDHYATDVSTSNGFVVRLIGIRSSSLQFPFTRSRVRRFHFAMNIR
jgi:ferric-chelate reductase (NADPH)